MSAVITRRTATLVIPARDLCAGQTILMRDDTPLTVKSAPLYRGTVTLTVEELTTTASLRPHHPIRVYATA